MRKFKGAGWKPTGPSRSNTTSSIRGKISAPIPININDDEFPIRLRGNSIVTPIGNEGLEKQLRPPPPAPLRDDKPQLPEEGEIPASTEDGSTPGPPATLSMASSHEPSVSQARQTSPVRRSGTNDPSRSSTEKLQRKKSTLRTVLGRLFGKKRKSGSSTVTNVHQSGSPRADQHRSDPTALRRLSGLALSPVRSASMPINDYSRALSSHAPLVGDIQTQDFDNTRDSKELDEGIRPLRRATSSRLFDPTRTVGYMDWTGLSPRPASSHARGSGLFADASQGQIGFAVTSGSHPNRRSRSLGALRDAAGRSDFRRRSEEIRYLRESYDHDALSPMSSQHKSDFNAGQENDPSLEAEIPEMPQPFNFGPFGELAGMKITQAASLESRVATLEERLERMEKAIGHLFDRRPSSSYISRPKTDSTEQSLPRHAPNKMMYLQSHNPQADTSYRMQNRSHESSRPSTTSTQPSYKQSYEELSPRPAYQSSPEPSPQIRTNISALQSESMGRPLSTSTTIRAIASSSPTQTPPRTLPMSKNGSLTAHHYSALMNLIAVEQSAREQLEAQVATLQGQIQSLLSQSKPKEDNDNDSVYSSPHSRPHNVPDHRKTMGIAGEFSSFEHEESGNETQSEADEERRESEEIYATPNEERDHYGSTEEYEHEIAGVNQRRVSEPRTLSLSQMTMGKTALATVGF